MLRFNLKDGCFSISQVNKKYVNIDCKRNGIQISFSDNITSRFSYRIDRFLDCYVCLSPAIKNAYKFSQNYIFPRNEEDTYFVPGTKIARTKPFYVPSELNYVFDENKIQKQKTIKTDGYKVCVSELNEKLCKVRFCYGKKNLMVITVADDSDKEIPKLKDLQREYGYFLYKYPYEEVEYLHQIKNGTVAVPTVFMREWNENTHQFNVEKYVMEDGSVVIAPQTKKCFIDGTEIDPKKEKIETKRVCHNCNENDELREIIGLIKDIGASVTELKEQSFSLEEKIKKLEDQIHLKN